MYKQNVFGNIDDIYCYLDYFRANQHSELTKILIDIIYYLDKMIHTLFYEVIMG